MITRLEKHVPGPKKKKKKLSITLYFRREELLSILNPLHRCRRRLEGDDETE